jgi:UDP-N-acetylmuramoyl-tripeptide--D-alanyl-D-alanine ligase
MKDSFSHFSLEQIANWTSGSLHNGAPEILVKSVAFDSRKLTSEGLFVALVADRDGHDYIPTAVESGAAAVLLSDVSKAPATLPYILVEDTLKAMGDLASGWRQANQCSVVGITGSNGKTTCKEMVATILDQIGPTLKTAGNFNNLIGLPMTLFQLKPKHAYAVLEMGMNAPGEIAQLAAIAAPQVGVITCVAAAHLEGLGSIEGVAKAKGELFAELAADSTAVINADDPHVLALQKSLNCRRIFFTTQTRANSSLPDSAQVVSLESSESLGTDGFRLEVQRPVPGRGGLLVSGGKTEVISFTLPLVGRHQVSNALAAIATVSALNIPASSIAKGLAKIEPTGRRMRVVDAAQHGQLIDDCYNSNPNSARAALQTLRELGEGQETIAVLGDMLELGAGAKHAHASVGRFAAATKLHALFAFGPLGKETANAAQLAGMDAENIFHFEDVDELWDALQPRLHSQSWVLVKGSRGMRLERISERIEAKGD